MRHEEIRLQVLLLAKQIRSMGPAESYEEHRFRECVNCLLKNLQDFDFGPNNLHIRML